MVWCVKAEEAEAEEARDTESKTRTPHKVVGNKNRSVNRIASPILSPCHVEGVH